MAEVSKKFQHAGMKRDDLKKLVYAAEKDAAKELGGPVIRKHKFVDDSQNVIFTWWLA